MVKVSVIIPVYNGEKYLQECMDSLLAQSGVSCEFIFVNDGSSDDSQKIIEKNRAKDHRILLINQENQGVSAARNAGMAVAKGEYLGFVDADDFIEKGLFETLYARAKNHNSDIVISNFYAEQGHAKLLVQFDFPENRLYSKTDIQNKIFPYFIEKDLMNSACNKIYKREIIEKNEIQFPVGVALGEDAIFNMKAFNAAQSAYYTDYAGYHYREVSGSATRNVGNKDYFKKALEVYHFDYASVMDLNIPETELQKLKAARLISSLLSLVHLYFYNTKIGLKFRFRSIREMTENEEVVKNLGLYFNEFSKNKSAYTRFLLKSVKNRDIYRLYLATLYSKFRNR